MEVEFLILADAAEAVNGKLYMLGGGWDVLTINRPLPYQQPFAIAAGLLVPWNATNQRHDVEVEIQTDDGEVAVKMAGQLELGRPPGLPTGHPQRVVLTFSGFMNIAAPGTFAIVAKIQGQESKRVSFRVVSLAPVTS